LVAYDTGRSPYLRLLDAAALRQLVAVAFNGEHLAGQPLTGYLLPPAVAGRPAFRVAVWSGDPKRFNIFAFSGGYIEAAVAGQVDQGEQT